MSSMTKVLLAVGVLALSASAANARMGAFDRLAGNQPGVVMCATTTTPAPATTPAASTPASVHRTVAHTTAAVHKYTAKEVQALMTREDALHKARMTRLQASLDKETKENDKASAARIQKLIDGENSRHDRVMADLKKKMPADASATPAEPAPAPATNP